MSECWNNEPEFDILIENYLGYYVYELLDPFTQKPFYVGKGGGDGSGNQRILDHFKSAKALRDKPNYNPSPKIKKIWEIWDAGKRVDWRIIRRGLPDSDTALHIEAALIDAIGAHNLTNLQKGHGLNESGILVPEELYLKSAPALKPSCAYPAVLIFSIKKSIRERGPYEATRGWWTGTQKWEQIATHAVGIIDGVSACVIDIQSWVGGDKDSKRGFEGRSYTDPGTHELLYKNFSPVINEALGYWQRGGWLAVEFNPGGWSILRGKQSKTSG